MRTMIMPQANRPSTNKRRRWMGQISPYGCFPTAVINSYIYKGLTPPDYKRLIEASQCETHKGTPEKVKLLRGVRGVYFRRAGVDEVLASAGIITFNCRRYDGHSAFFFRSGKRIYAVNGNLFSDNILEEISIKRFKDEGETFHDFAHWVVL